MVSMNGLDLTETESDLPYLIGVGKSPTGRAPDRLRNRRKVAPPVSKKQKRGGESFFGSLSFPAEQATQP
jgi:hypothetical protein